MKKSDTKSNYWRVFALCFLTAVLLFLPHCIIDAAAGGGYFHYAGDFNDQQINFYQYANAFVKQGGTFSWATDLGSGFVNSYSFYLLGSPFFWLSLAVPARLMPWAMVPLLCLKMAVAGGGAYLWARRWVREEGWSMLAGCLYAFSGFSIYNIFFNHFLDVVALFPYLLAALDDAAIDGKKGRFPFWVALNLLNNYFFFAGQAVFLIIYFFCMVAGRRYRIGLRRFAALAWETALGCACGCLLLLPAGLSLLQNPRTIDPFTGYGYLFYGKSQQYGAIFYSPFLMPDAPYFKDMFQEGILKHTSLTAYLPLVGAAGGLAFCRTQDRHPFTRILKVCVVCAFVPVLNSAFYALNSSFYARWYYMPILVLCGATCCLLSRPALAERSLPRAFGLTTFITLTAAVFAVLPNKDSDGSFCLGVLEEPARFWALFGVTVLGIVLFGLLWHFCHRKRQWSRILLAGVLGFSLVYGSLHLSLTKYAETDAYLIYENENWVPMGFTYDYYVTADQLERVGEEERAQILCRALLLDEDQISAFGSLLRPLPDAELTRRSEEAYAADCADRRAAAVAEFAATRTGFTAKTAYDTDALVFFSVPYDDGFTAAVNGEPAAIEKVDNGMMAVYVPAGENEIEFTYHTPGLKVSAIVSAVAIVVYGVYLGILRKKKRA